VTTTIDAGLLSAPDDDHIAFARSDARVIVTQDTDFLRSSAGDPTHCGVVYFPHGKHSFGDVIRHLALMNDSMFEEEMVGRIEYL
jgi:predicted nuclease of predicted toxin-antitoxin system